ncbi:hypothetical protein QBC38DRAFT_377270 [Podospora fimiseda]|uniref:Uncharacterized protein n=1 Tax=Podospora fimiseda TaxID=252190 RepID=A0AAN6YL95_9PEZI|nr:hypothetical protein QBC38DRAFT_377270 [Podospora fimiseda]
MRPTLQAFLTLLTLAGATTQNSQQDGCPGTELACHDIMNSSQCIANVVDNRVGNPREALIECVVHEGTASNLPGASKVCRQVKEEIRRA